MYRVQGAWRSSRRIVAFYNAHLSQSWVRGGYGPCSRSYHRGTASLYVAACHADRIRGFGLTVDHNAYR
jgi:hypothetical protein